MKLSYFRDTYHEHGHWHTDITIYGTYGSDPLCRPIDAMIAECVPPNYQTPEICSKVRAKFVALRDSGVTAVAQTLYVPSVRLSWLHYGEGSAGPKDATQFCTCNVHLSTRPRDLARDLELYKRILRSMTHDWTQEPSQFMAYFKRCKATALTRVQLPGELSELVTLAA